MLKRNVFMVIACVVISTMPLLGAIYNITDYDGQGDGKTDNTKAFQKAIAACSLSGGGTVYVPAGTFMTGTVKLKSHIRLELNRMAVIKGIADKEAYQGGALIVIDKVEDVSVGGEGTINGNGGQEVFLKGDNARGRPYIINCRKSKGIVIKDVFLKNSAAWTLRLLENDGVRIDGIRIYSHTNWNNDGIDIDSKNVIISNCNIDCDDDALCFKSDTDALCENVVVTNCILASNCNLIKFGTSSFTGFKNIAVSNCVLKAASESNFRDWSEKIEGISDPITGISGIALEVVDGGHMNQITINNISMVGIQTPVFIRLGRRRNPTGSLKNVIISNIVATPESLLPSCISGVPGFDVENVIIRDMIVQPKGGGTVDDATRSVPENEKGYPENRMFGHSLPAYGMYVRHAENIRLENIQFWLRNNDARPALWFEDAKNVKVRDFQTTSPSDEYKLIEVRDSNVTFID